MNKKIDILNETNYYFITDSGSEVSILDQVKIAVESGVKMIQYRDKTKNDREKYKELKEIKEICEGKSLLIVNDRVDLAWFIDADGVHLGQNDLPPKEVKKAFDDMIVGISTHNEKQAERAKKTADYVAVGPIFKTQTKEDVDPELGMKRAKDIAESIKVPTVAIGGVNEENISDLVEPFDIVCAISEVTRKGKITDRINKLERKIENAKEGK